MITKDVLKKLITHRLLDSKVLLANRRYFASIYIAGYAMELALKYRICSIMKFNKGFPENRQEFDHYYSDTRKTFLRVTIRELKDIRHHKLAVLLRYSGEEINILNNLRSEWDIVKKWDPEMRYTNPLIRKQKATTFLQNCISIIDEII